VPLARSPQSSVIGKWSLRCPCGSGRRFSRVPPCRPSDAQPACHSRSPRGRRSPCSTSSSLQFRLGLQRHAKCSGNRSVPGAAVQGTALTRRSVATPEGRSRGSVTVCSFDTSKKSARRNTRRADPLFPRSALASATNQTTPRALERGFFLLAGIGCRAAPSRRRAVLMVSGVHDAVQSTPRATPPEHGGRDVWVASRLRNPKTRERSAGVRAMAGQ
jgi:hypothetical protein